MFDRYFFLFFYSLLIRRTLMDEGVFVALTTFIIVMCIMDDILWMTHHGLLIMDDTL